MNGARERSTDGVNWSPERTSRNGSDTLATGIEYRPSASRVAPVGRSTTDDAGEVSLAVPVSFFAETVTRRVCDTSAVAAR